MSEAQNQLVLTGTLSELDKLRHTPAGVPALNFRLSHTSTQTESGLERQVEVELDALVLGQLAQLLSGARLGGAVKVAGFLAAKSLKSRRPVLHVNELEFLEGNDHGI